MSLPFLSVLEARLRAFYLNRIMNLCAYEVI